MREKYGIDEIVNECIDEILNDVDEQKLTDEFVWLQMFKCYAAQKFTTYEASIKADEALNEFKIRFRKIG